MLPDKGYVLLEHAQELVPGVVQHWRLPNVPSLEVHEHGREHEAVHIAHEGAGEVQAGSRAGGVNSGIDAL